MVPIMPKHPLVGLKIYKGRAECLLHHQYPNQDSQDRETKDLKPFFMLSMSNEETQGVVITAVWPLGQGTVVLKKI